MDARGMFPNSFRLSVRDISLFFLCCLNSISIFETRNAFQVTATHVSAYMLANHNRLNEALSSVRVIRIDLWSHVIYASLVNKQHSHKRPFFARHEAILVGTPSCVDIKFKRL